MATIIIPQSGRTCYAALSKLAPLLGQDISGLVKALKGSKSDATPDSSEAHKALQSLGDAGAGVTLRPDRKREDRPYRLSFLGLDGKIEGIDVRVEGEEPHNCSSSIRLAEADIAIVGFDELLSTMQSYLEADGKYVTRWGDFNARLTSPTDVRIAGSAELLNYNNASRRMVQDFVGFFLIGKKKKPVEEVQKAIENGARVFVKGRYEGIAINFFPGIKTSPVNNVEEAVLDDWGSLGLEIVHSGETVNRKGLFVYGSPLFMSESLIVADYGKYSRNPDVRKVVDALSPVGFLDTRRVIHFGNWYEVLEDTLGNRWIDKPPVEELFYGGKDNVCQPYSLTSKEWVPPAVLPTEKLIEEIIHIGNLTPSLQASLRTFQGLRKTG